MFDIERKEEDDRKLSFFEKEIYPNFSFDTKAKYWSGVLHNQMRWQEESGLDPYAIYDNPPLARASCSCQQTQLTPLARASCTPLARASCSCQQTQLTKQKTE